ncbi:hypothetical protein IEQ34_019220 [Dendrobium chrysotoxum]|uniref:Uncharacterized protein n=1 Tax=Dendrobium chrysotoxum TaxID=161865 RepID=A0AAV7G676_DENCH|nr:hypothetical protein IEQ34_019220 [Dendrobium chrysotoxum]
MSTGTSTFVIRWVNFLTMILGLGVICFGIWMSTHHDQCHRTLTLPVIGLGALILLISLVGFLGALKNITFLLWVYLAILFLTLVAILVFTVLAFIITNSGSGHAVSGIKFKEYHLQDYSAWFLKQLNNTKNWDRLKSCLVKSDDCNNLPNKYKTLKAYKSAELSPVEAGCCRPPSEYVPLLFYSRERTKKMEALEGEMEQFKTGVEKFSTMKERFSYMENRMENRFRRVEEMLRRLLEMKTKTSRVVLMANPNQDLTEIPLAESKEKEIRQEEFDEGSFFH